MGCFFVLRAQNCQCVLRLQWTKHECCQQEPACEVSHCHMLN